MKEDALEVYGITSKKIKYQLSSEELQALVLKNGMGKESSAGAIAIQTGEFTGRSPMDRFIVKDELTSEKIW